MPDDVKPEIDRGLRKISLGLVTFEKLWDAYLGVTLVMMSADAIADLGGDGVNPLPHYLKWFGWPYYFARNRIPG